MNASNLYGDVVVCREQYGSQPIQRRYLRTSTGTLQTVDESRKLTSASQFFRSVFLPAGYPESVSSDYKEYQIWDTIQAFCSSITGTLATQAILKGVGVGDEKATVLAATMTWLMKSGTGMVGQILFAWTQGTYLDNDCKRWRLFADILNDFAIFLDMIAPHFELYFTPIICIAGVCRSVVGVAGGATRAALTQHQARRNNMADVSAKDGSQETLVNLVALLFNLMLVPMVTGNHTLIWLLYLVFTSLHLYANYRAVSCVTMETFNQTRFHLVVQHFLASPESAVLSVKEANRREPVISKLRTQLKVKLGSSVAELMNSYDDFQKLTTIYYGSKYLLGIDMKKGIVYICLHEDAIVYDQLAACYQAAMLEHALAVNAGLAPYRPEDMSPSGVHMYNVAEATRHGDVLSMLVHSHKFVLATFPSFLGAVEAAGWTTAHALLRVDEWRARWDAHGVTSKAD